MFSRLGFNAAVPACPFQISLDPPIKQGQTRYHFLILLFSKDEDISLTLNMNE